MGFTCEACKYSTNVKNSYTRHMNSETHKRSTCDADISEFKYQCVPCKYGTNSNDAYMAHCRTKRHVKLATQETEFKCDCRRFFHSKKSLTYHKKKCDWTPPAVEEATSNTQPSTTDPQILKMILEQNQKLMQIIENGVGSVTNNNNNTQNNTTNNTQNIQFNFHSYLEEKCSDAIDLNQFVKNIEITENDLEAVLKLDNPRALGEIILREMEKYKPEERPLHCTDVKRKHVFEKCVGGGWEEHEAEWRTTEMFGELFKECAEKQAGEIKRLYRGMEREMLNTNKGRDIISMAIKMHPDKYEGRTKQYAGAYNEILSAVKVSGKQPLDV